MLSFRSTGNTLTGSQTQNMFPVFWPPYALFLVSGFGASCFIRYRAKVYIHLHTYIYNFNFIHIRYCFAMKLDFAHIRISFLHKYQCLKFNSRLCTSFSNVLYFSVGCLPSADGAHFEITSSKFIKIHYSSYVKIYFIISSYRIQ